MGPAQEDDDVAGQRGGRRRAPKGDAFRDALVGLLADALDAMVRGLSDDGVVVSTENNTERGTAAVVFGLMTALSGSTAGADFSTSVAHLREFAAFCRASGGFEVW